MVWQVEIIKPRCGGGMYPKVRGWFWEHLRAVCGNNGGHEIYMTHSDTWPGRARGRDELWEVVFSSE